MCVVVCCVADPLLFLGGDEVHNSCYSADNSTAEYLKEHHLEPPAMVDLFWQNVQADVRIMLVPLAQDCYALRCTHTVRVYVCVHVCGCGHQVWPNVSAGKRTLGVWVSDMPVRNVHTHLVTLLYSLPIVTRSDSLGWLLLLFGTRRTPPAATMALGRALSYQSTPLRLCSGMAPS